MGRKNERAFTLLELLLVVFIIGILATLVVQKFVGVSRDTQIRATKAQINAFEGALERYKLDMEKYPTTEEGLRALRIAPDDEDLAKKWKGPYLTKPIPKDPWDHDYVYKCPGERDEAGFDLYSWGPDGEEGTEDDITNWAAEEE